MLRVESIRQRRVCTFVTAVLPGGFAMTDQPDRSPDMSGRAWGELMLLSALWGGSFFSVAIALRELGPFTVVLHRVAWAALLLWVSFSPPASRCPGTGGSGAPSW